MSAVTGIVAGFAVAAGAVALYRFVERRAKAARRSLKNVHDGRGVLDFEFDASSGLYRAK